MRNVVLLAGGTGNIGSHAVEDLLKRGKSVLILDNLCNCSSKVRDRMGHFCLAPVVSVRGYLG